MRLTTDEDTVRLNLHHYQTQITLSLEHQNPNPNSISTWTLPISGRPAASPLIAKWYQALWCLLITLLEHLSTTHSLPPCCPAFLESQTDESNATNQLGIFPNERMPCRCLFSVSLSHSPWVSPEQLHILNTTEENTYSLSSSKWHVWCSIDTARCVVMGHPIWRSSLCLPSMLLVNSTQLKIGCLCETSTILFLYLFVCLQWLKYKESV